MALAAPTLREDMADRSVQLPRDLVAGRCIHAPRRLAAQILALQLLAES